MKPLNVRRLVAVDMYGLNGGLVRRRVIAAEYLLGATAGTAVGLFVMIVVPAPGWTLFGAWVAGACLNYVPLSVHALRFLDRRALEAELRDADLRRELRYYTVTQLWLAVPLLLVVISIPQAVRQNASR